MCLRKIKISFDHLWLKLKRLYHLNENYSISQRINHEWIECKGWKKERRLSSASTYSSMAWWLFCVLSISVIVTSAFWSWLSLRFVVFFTLRTLRSVVVYTRLSTSAIVFSSPLFFLSLCFNSFLKSFPTKTRARLNANEFL